MIPRTFPSSFNSQTGQQELVALFLDSVTGLQRWADYIPVNFAQGTTLVEGSYNNNGFIAIREITSSIGLQAFLDYIPVFFDATATDAWRVSDMGFIPYGVSGVTSSPSLDLVFTRSDTLDPRITFTRSTTATRTNSSGLIESVAIDGPRFDYDPVTLAPKGLLIEEQRTNLLVRSIPDAAVPTGWTVGVGTGTFTHTLVPATASLSGFQNFIRHEQTVSGRSYLTTTVTLVASTTYTLTIRFNPGTLSVTSGNPAVIFIQGLTGATGTLSLNASSVPSNGVASITFTTATAVSAGIRVGLGCANDATGVAEFGAWQLEAGAFATSYIPTVASQVTRAADVALMTGTNFSSWYNAATGTLFSEHSAVASGIRTIAALNDGTSNESIRLRTDATNPLFTVTDNSSDVANLDAGTVATGTVYKFAGAYAVNDFAASISGGAAVTDTSGALPTVNRMMIGNSSSSNFLNGHIRKVAYYPRRLADAELQAITS